MRNLFKLNNYKNITRIAADYILNLPEENIERYDHENKQLIKNSISSEHKKIIQFFNAEFEVVYMEVKKNKEYLGWSDSLSGIVVPLYLLMLMKRYDTKAAKCLMDNLARRIDYNSDQSKECFQDIFIMWKSKMDLSLLPHGKYINWLDETIDRRTEAVVGGGYRNSYYKAVELIVALGEVKEANGEKNGKIKLIEHYKRIHSRKSAFKSELNTFH